MKLDTPEHLTSVTHPAISFLGSLEAMILF
jgi:hypothetical protein